MEYDALLVLSFGGPEGPEDVVPFLQNVTRGRNIPAERLAEVAANYERFGGVSPINDACRALIAALEPKLDVPIYWGNRNWTPVLTDTVRTMAADGVRHAACFVTSAYAGYSACRQYLDDIAGARAAVGAGAPRIDKLRPFFDHPGFIEPLSRNVTVALDGLAPRLRAGAHLALCAHSIPVDQPGAATYVAQVTEAARLVAERVAGDHPWAVCWQSRSGPPSQPWLAPDVGDHLAQIKAPGAVLVPVGFVADHMEVVYDLDVVAAERAAELGLTVTRAATVGTAPEFVAMIPELIAERGRAGEGDDCGC